MKKNRFFALVLMLALFIGGALPARADNVAPVATDSASYIVMDAATGQVLIEKNADEIMYPASITKIMILGLACEKAQGNWDTVITVGDEEITSLEREAAHVALRPGEEVRLEDMLYATCLQSACDAANVLAVYVGGSIQGGVDAMNAKAAELGLPNTHFTNPTGLHDENLLSTARDMGIITRWALKQPGFRDVFCRVETWIMAPTNVQENSRYFYCDDHMRLGGFNLFKEYAKGSKSGWHDQALYTQVTLGEKNDLELIAVVFRATTRDNKYNDLIGMLEYCFDHFHRVRMPVAGANIEIPVWGGSGKLGNITLSSPDGVEVLVADGVDPGQLEAEMNVPEKYVLGTAFEPSVTIHLQGCGKQSDSSFRVPMKITGLETLLSANTYVRAFTASEHRHIGVALALLLVIVIAFVIALRIHRGNTRARKMRPTQVTHGETRQVNIRVVSSHSNAPARQDHYGYDGYRNSHRNQNRRG